MFKKYVALDVGDVRIGVAKSDIMGILATPLEVIDRRKVKAVKRIEEILIQENTKSLVIGIPKGALEKRKVVDKVAAAIILQTFLDRKK